MIGIQPYQVQNRGWINCGMVRCNTMKVSGKGTVSAVPDTAVATLGVVTENMQLETAQRENAEKINTVIQSLTVLGIPREDIQTQSYRIQPQYDYVDGKQIFRGYQVTHELKVEINQIGMTGRAIDTAVRAGANTVSGIEFTISNPSAYYSQALNNALNDAVGKAAVIGRNLNVHVLPVPIQIVEETYQVGAPVPYTAIQSTGTTTPVMPGQIEITALIETIFSYGS